jgi:hypothetical protein
MARRLNYRWPHLSQRVHGAPAPRGGGVGAPTFFSLLFI